MFTHMPIRRLQILSLLLLVSSSTAEHTGSSEQLGTTAYGTTSESKYGAQGSIPTQGERIQNMRPTPATTDRTTWNYGNTNNDNIQNTDAPKRTSEIRRRKWTGTPRYNTISLPYPTVKYSKPPTSEPKYRTFEQGSATSKGRIQRSLCSPREFVDSVNQLRRQNAMKYNLPRMYKLSWDDDLEKVVKSFKYHAPGTSWEQARNVFRYTVEDDFCKVPTITIEAKLSQFLNSSPTQRQEYLKEEMNRFFVPFLELMVPSQTHIACGETTDSFMLCVLGPSGNFSLWEPTDAKTTKLGSNCKSGYKKTYGLCTPIGTADRNLLGTPSQFIGELNQARQEFAHEFGVKIMNNLSWSHSLVKMAKDHQDNQTKKEDQKILKFIRLTSLRGIADRIEKDLFVYDHLKSAARRANKPSPWQSQKGVLGLLNGELSSIGCFFKTTQTEFYYDCAIGFLLDHFIDSSSKKYGGKKKSNNTN